MIRMGVKLLQRFLKYVKGSRVFSGGSKDEEERVKKKELSLEARRAMQYARRLEIQMLCLNIVTHIRCIVSRYD